MGLGLAIAYGLFEIPSGALGDRIGYYVRVSGNYNFPLIVIGAMVLASSVLFLKIVPTRPIVQESRT